MSDVLRLRRCPECGHVGIEGVTVGPWPGDGQVRCPSQRCEYRTVMDHERTYVPEDTLRAEVERLREALTGMVAAFTTGVFKDKALADAVAALSDQDDMSDFDPLTAGGGGPCESCGREQEPWRFSALCQACIWDRSSVAASTDQRQP